MLTRRGCLGGSDAGPDSPSPSPSPSGSNSCAPGADQCWPTVHSTISSPYGSRPKIKNGFHDGIDIRSHLGDPIYSVENGTILDIYHDSNGGNQILIQNEDGGISGYAHTGALNSLQVGQPVRAGDQIGVSDGSGTEASHLHYTYRPPQANGPATRATRRVDPFTHQLDDLPRPPNSLGNYMQSRSVGILIGLLLGLQSASVSATELARAERSKDAVMDFAVDFRKAILERNMPYLKDVTSESGGLDEADFPFIFGDGSVHRSGDTHGKSVAEILSSDKLGIAYEGGIDRSAEKGRGARYLLIYYLPKRDQFRQLWLTEILAHRKWMADYVACQVERKGQKWKLMWSFCYAETEGP